MKHEADEVSGPLYDYLGHFTRPEYLRAGHNTTRTKPGRPKKSELSGQNKESSRQKKIHEAFSEVMHNTPSTVKRANVSAERKHKMKIAIALSKLRKQGVSVAKRK